MLREDWFLELPLLLLLTYRHGILTFLILRLKGNPDWRPSSAVVSKEYSFEGGFSISRKEVIQAAYLDE